MLIVDVDTNNFIDKPEDMSVVIDKVNASITRVILRYPASVLPDIIP